MTNEELVLLIQQGHKEYCSELWGQVRKLIHKLIFEHSKKRILPNDIEHEDLHQCGYFAMLAAVKAYNPDKSYKFNTYLEYHIKNTINEAVNHGKRLGQNIPTVKVYSYNKTIAGVDGEETELIDFIKDENSEYEYEPLEISDLQAHVWKAVAELPERQQEIIRRYYLQGTSLTDIAKEKGISVENIRTRKKQGLQMLRKSKDLRAFYREYLQEPYFRRDLYLPYWSISPERYAVEKDIHERRQQGEYISYGKEQVLMSAAKAEYSEQVQEQRHRYGA